MKFTNTETERLVPNNTSDVGLQDNDSGLRLFRGIMSPWGAIKSFKETYNFALRHAAMMAVAWADIIQIIEPDYAKAQTAASDAWAKSMDETWEPGAALEEFEDRFDIPPFIKNGLYRASTYCDKGDEQMLITGHIFFASDDAAEKEAYDCQFDIAGPFVCDQSVGGGCHFCYGLAGSELNNYDPQRKGCGDPYCHVVIEHPRKYGAHKNNPDRDWGGENGAKGYEWESWGPCGQELREEGLTGKYYKKECEFLNTGEFTATTGAKWTAGQMYKDFVMWPLAYSTNIVDALNEISDADTYKNVMEKIFDTAGKFQFSEKVTRKAIRDWMMVPDDVDDGRVMGAYMQMLLDARGVPCHFIKFEEDEVVLAFDEIAMAVIGTYFEFCDAYLAYFNAAIKCLVNTAWVVERGEDTDDFEATFVIKKALYGYRRQKTEAGYEYQHEVK